MAGKAEMGSFKGGNVTTEVVQNQGKCILKKHA